MAVVGGQWATGEAGERLPFMGNGESDCHKRAKWILPIKGKWIAFKGRPNPNGILGGQKSRLKTAVDLRWDCLTIKGRWSNSHSSTPSS